MANAADLRVISQAATSVSQDLAALIDDVRTGLIFHTCLYLFQFIACKYGLISVEVLHISN